MLTLGTHDFENDRDLNFEDYPYNLELRPLNLGTSEEREQWMADWLHVVYQALKATQEYRLPVAEDLQIKLEEFIPAPVVAVTPTT